MNRSAVLVLPKNPPQLGEEWSALSRSEKLSKLEAQDSDLDRALRDRMPRKAISHLVGVRAWSVEIDADDDIELIREALADLPVEVAPDTTFHAIGGEAQS